MKKKKVKLSLEDIDVESMEVINAESLSTFIGGQQPASWDCILKCFDYMDDHQMNGYSSYYSGGSYISPYYGSYNPQQVGGFYNGDVHCLGLNGNLAVDMVSSVGVTRAGKTQYGQSIMLTIPGANGLGHAVIITGVIGSGSATSYTYWDPTLQQNGNTSTNGSYGYFVFQNK